MQELGKLYKRIESLRLEKLYRRIDFADLERHTDLDHAGRILAILCVLVLARYLVSVLYSIFLHPLRKFPGPPLARISRLWSRVGNFKGRKSERIHQAHMQYGPVVRVGPNELSFSDPEAVKDINTNSVFIKDDTFYSAKRIFHEEFLLSFRNPEAHRQRRKLLSRGFSQSAMLEFEPHIDTKIQAMLDQWSTRTKNGQIIDVFGWCHWLGFDIVYHLLFDEDPLSVTLGRSHEVMPYFRAWKPTFAFKEFFPFLERYGVYVPGVVGDKFRAVNRWKKYAEKIVQACREKDTKTPFLRHILYGEKDGFLGRPLTNSEIAEECMGGMFGGSGTTANTFVMLLWAALRRPDITARLQQELKTVFPAAKSVPEYRECIKLPLLQAVINETLRLYPTILATLPRTATEDATVNGVAIPKGTTVGTQNYTIHRYAEAFVSPEEWNPDRWLGKDGDTKLKDSWNPFSIGPRKCIGINLAQMELSKMTAAFFRRFDGKVDPSMTEEQMRLYDTFNAGPAGTKLLLQLREIEG